MKPDLSDLMTKPPLAKWLKGAEVAFKKKFLGPKLYEMLNEDPTLRRLTFEENVYNDPGNP